MNRLLLRQLTLFLVLTTIVMAGEVTPDLQTQLNTPNKNQLIRVWIKLPRTESPDQLKLSVNAAASTRNGRYAEAYNRLKSSHRQSQQSLLAALNQLVRSGKCSHVKASWLANVVEAEIAAGELPALASRKDVEIVCSVPVLTLIEPDKSAPSQTESQSQQAGVEPNLTYIKAPQAWAAGYTGAGRIICSFDTGIDGQHPALINNWKGLNGDSAAAWFDPLDHTSFPNTVLGDNHGTHVMGILVGHNNATGDTVGVALNAKWISAAVVDINGASYIDAFEWAADPDGDPNSVDDVPDVINHSWGIKGIGCQSIFHELIDNLEALGIVNVFACGNDGPGIGTIRNPANRANDSLDCFAVGNVNTGNPPIIQGSSSRGPSDCNGAIKPNVCAPGLNIRSATIGTGYTTLSGTSISTPHVAGLVALLRQKNPNATVDQIKTAILNTTQRFSFTIPNNNIGWGVIDCIAALNALSATNSTPNVRLYAFDHNTILPGSTVGGKIVLQNLGAAVTPVTATLMGSNPSITILDGSASFGAIASNDTLRSSDSIKVRVSDTVSVGSILSLNLRITNGGTYTDTFKIYFPVEPPTQRLFVTHNIGAIDFSVTNFGTYGLGASSFFPIGGVGFAVNGGDNDMFEGGLLIGIDSAHVSDGVRNSIGEPDGDFRVSPGGNIVINLPGAGTAQKSRSRFDDSRAEHPIGIGVRQMTYSFAEPNLDDFIIMRYLVTNTNPFPVNDVYVGLYLDWDIFDFISDAGGYDLTNHISWMAYNNNTTMSFFRGAAVLTGNNAGSLTELANQVSYPGGFTEVEKANALGVGFSTASTYANVQTDLFQVVSAGPLNLTAGETEIVTFALLAGNNSTDLSNAATAAANINDSLLNPCCVGIRGNINNDGINANVLDLTYMVDDIFRGGPASPCLQESDLNGDGASSTVADLTFLIDFMFRGGADPLDCPGY